MRLHIKAVFLSALILLIGASAAAFIDFGQFFNSGDFDSVFDETGDVAVIELSGSIMPTQEGFGTSDITPEDVRSLTSIAKSEGADAIIYEVNSGGGAVVASKEVMQAIDNAEVPTVCRIRDVGASGAYLVSLGCDSIVVDEVSLTGSIGVTASYLEFSDLMDELGVEYVNITSGESKEQGSPFQEPSDEDLQVMEDRVDIVHEHFIDIVDENRNMTDQQIDDATTGQVFLGQEAHDMGLVDAMGGHETAMTEAENLTGKELSAFRVDDTPDLGLLDLFLPALSVENILGINDQAPLQARFP